MRNKLEDRRGIQRFQAACGRDFPQAGRAAQEEAGFFWDGREGIARGREREALGGRGTPGYVISEGAAIEREGCDGFAVSGEGPRTLKGEGAPRVRREEIKDRVSPQVGAQASRVVYFVGVPAALA